MYNDNIKNDKYNSVRKRIDINLDKTPSKYFFSKSRFDFVVRYPMFPIHFDSHDLLERLFISPKIYGHILPSKITIETYSRRVFHLFSPSGNFSVWSLVRHPFSDENVFQVLFTIQYIYVVCSFGLCYSF